MIWPTLEDNKKPEPLYDYTHYLPLVLLTIDWLLNRMYVELNQFIVTFGFFFAYMIFNLIFTKVTGKPVYALYGWDSVGAWIRAMVTIGSSTVVYLCFWGLTHLKFKLLKEAEREDIGPEQP